MLNSNKAWNKAYSRGIRGKYPNEMLIRFINAKFKDVDRNKINILDLGFGTGRHLVYLADEGFNVSGIETSAAAAEIARTWLQKRKLKAKIQTGSFVRIVEKDNMFDAVIDVASIQHNNFGDIKKIAAEMLRILKPGGYAFSYIKTKNDSLYSESEKIDNRTHLVVSGKLKKADQNTIISFLSKKDIESLYSGFSHLSLEKEEWTYDNMKKKISHWVITAKK